MGNIYVPYMCDFGRKWDPTLVKNNLTTTRSWKTIYPPFESPWVVLSRFMVRTQVCAHTGTQLEIFLKIGEISNLGPPKSGGFVPPGCAYWGAHHGGFIARGLSYNIFRSQLLTPISSKVMVSDSFSSQIGTNFQISFIYERNLKVGSNF